MSGGGEGGRGKWGKTEENENQDGLIQKSKSARMLGEACGGCGGQTWSSVWELCGSVKCLTRSLQASTTSC